MDSEIVYNADGKPMRRVKKAKTSIQVDESDELRSKEGLELSTATLDKTKLDTRTKLQKEADTLRELQAEVAAKEEADARRECPVPKPKGVIRRLMGFEETNDKVGVR